MSFIDKFYSYFKSIGPVQKDIQFLIAVSGGVDSVVLCHLCHNAGINFSIAHCNFGLRGEESIRDEEFVSSLAEKYQVTFYLNRFNTKTFAEERKISIQEAARKLRYNWFSDILKGMVDQYKVGVEDSVENKDAVQIMPKYLLTAHHLDDNIETVLMNFFKGTGISGLRGIQPLTGHIIRPLLFAKRVEIKAYADENELTWVEDSSNEETKYTRNYFRHNIIPAIEKVFPEAINNVAHNIQRFSETEMLYRQAVEIHKKKLLVYKGMEIHIPVVKLLKITPLNTIVYEIIKEFGFNHKQVVELLRLVNSESGKYITSSTHRILLNRNWLIIAPIQSADSQIVLIEKDIKEVIFDLQRLKISTIESDITISKDSCIALLDAKNIQYPLLLRKWKIGDYFYPLGMPKKKKLSRFFIDQKLSKGQKENVWVVESNKKIVWIIGLRIDDRFKIKPSSTKAIRLEVEKL